MIFEENDFSCHILLSEQVPSLTVWLPLLFETSGNLFIVIFCVPVYDINIKFTLALLSSRFTTKKARPKRKYLKNQNNFSDEIKIIIHLFERAFI